MDSPVIQAVIWGMIWSMKDISPKIDLKVVYIDNAIDWGRRRRHRFAPLIKFTISSVFTYIDFSYTHLGQAKHLYQSYEINLYLEIP